MLPMLVFTACSDDDEDVKLTFLTKEVADIIEYSASNSSKLTNLVDRDEKVRNIITPPRWKSRSLAANRGRFV